MIKLNKAFIRYEMLIIIGGLIFILSLLNIFNVIKVSGDLFWALVSLGLIVEGFIEKQGYVHDKKGL